LERLVTTSWSRQSLLLYPDGKQEPASEREWRLLRGLRTRVAGALPAAERAVAEAAAAGLRVLTLDDSGYPPALMENLSGPPPVLFVEGELPGALGNTYENLPACAVVGTRRASRFSTTFAKDLGRGLAELGAVVVSGLALGIDAAAHAGALEGARLAPEAGGGTVAVLGGGHHRFHPAANRSLAAAIVAAGGAVLSEWPPDVAPAPHQFLQRNRVISGLSRAVVIVEAGERSGAINTSSHALAQGREVLVVPGRPGPAMAGNLALLRDGAKLMVSLADLDTAFTNVPVVGPALASLALGGTGEASTVVPAARAATARGAVGRADVGPPGSGRGSAAALPATLPGRARAILELLGEATVDHLLQELLAEGEPQEQGAAASIAVLPTVATLTAALLELELSGEIGSGHNGRYHARVSLTRPRSASPQRGSRPRRG
ncbi:MAG TPA: DNA-processing protein DprA, partial [Trueperaceae bacterium]|nr:DNA-processing protein DprA [Trueperaceae bacterium]